MKNPKVSKKPIGRIGKSLIMVIIFLVVFLPSIEMSILTASNPRFAPSDAWCNSLLWMKENTPEPYGDPDAYYHRNYLIFSLSHGPLDYPESAYGVLAWWDYGYWISRIGRRIPIANPSQGIKPTTSVAKFLTAQDENSANKIAEELGSAYIIIDYQTATNKVWAIVLWAGGEWTDYFGIYYLPQGERLMPVRLYYPDYYRSLFIRLYNFDGKAVTPESVTVISYEERGGRKQIIGEKQFDNYEAAETYLLSQELGNYKIASKSPFISPVPLVEVESYRLIHSSDETVEYSEGGTRVPEVKIFEYLPISN